MKHLHGKPVWHNYGVKFRYPVCSFSPTHFNWFYLFPIKVKHKSNDTLYMLFLGVDHPLYRLCTRLKMKYKTIYEKSQDLICNVINTDTWFLCMDEVGNGVKHLMKFLYMHILMKKTIVFWWCMVLFSGIYKV